MDKNLIKLVFGLGNPEERYRDTYHNIGLFFIEEFSQRAKREIPELEFVISDEFMNKSGFALAKALRYRNLNLEECLIVHDDSDLKIGNYKIVFGGSDAGHKGVRDVIRQFGSQDFWRLRIGVRKANEEERRKAGEFVLNKVSEADERVIKKALEEAFEEITSSLET